MMSNYYTLALLASDLDSRIRGATIHESFTQKRDELALSLTGIPGALVVSCAPHANALYLHPHYSRSRRNSTAVLRNIAGKAVLSVSIQPLDRVISLMLPESVTLHFCFFGTKANAFLVDRNSQISDAFKSARSLIGETFTVSAGDIVHDPAGLRSLAARQPETKIVSLLRQVSPTLGSTLAREVLFRSNIPEAVCAKDLPGPALDMLQQCLSRVLTELSRPIPRVYVHKDVPHTPHRFSLVRLEHCSEYEERLFEDVHEAIRFFVSGTRSTHAFQSHSRSVLDSLAQRKAKLQRTVAALEADLTGTSRADEYGTYARLLMTNLGSIPKGAACVALPGDTGQELTIRLDPRLSAAGNAQHYFEKEKKSRLTYEQSRKRLEGLRESLRLIEKLHAGATAARTPEDLRAFFDNSTADLKKSGMGERGTERAKVPFRIFTVDGGYEVWAGKSSQNNDELTMKYTKPNDLWFHVRGGSGSHVVLKVGTRKGEPGRKAREQAAAIAAYYSKMKNAKVVPVAMTERKFVRKPKGSSPGTVVLDREKVVFAAPGLPQQESDHGS